MWHNKKKKDNLGSRRLIYCSIVAVAFCVIAIFLFSVSTAQAAVTWLTPTEITPGSASAWVDADVSSYVSANATGVLLHIVNTDLSLSLAVGFRKNGSTDNRTSALRPASHTWVSIGVDTNRILELYVGSSTAVDVYLVGYFESDASFFTNAVDKSLAVTSAWTDIDISADTGTDTAIGAIFEVDGNGQYRWYGLRKNGSTDDFYNGFTDIFTHGGAIIGVDASEILEGTIEDTVVDFFLVGYITANATFYTNATDITPATTDAWVDLSALPSTASGAFIEVVAPDTYGLRKNGSTENILAPYRHGWAMVEADSNQIIEGYAVSGLGSPKFYLVGYPEVVVSNNTPSVTSVTDSPDPVAAGDEVYFKVDWSDADSGEMVKVHICKTDAISSGVCSGGSWCDSPVFTNRDPETCSYTTQAGDIGTQSYYAFVCDDENACSTSVSGTFVVQEQEPTAPTDLLVENMTNPVNIATTTPRFSAIFNDPNVGDIANKYCIEVNTAADFTGTGMWIADSNSCKTGVSMSNTAQGSRSPDIYYKGSALSLDSTTYYWRMWFWDDSGNKSATSSVANFTMANGSGDSPRGVRLKGGRLRGGVRLK